MYSNSLSTEIIILHNNMRKQLVLFAMFGILMTLLAPTTYAQSESDFESELVKVDKQYQLLHEEYGFIHPKLSEEEQIQLDEKLQILDAEFLKIHESFGFTHPEFSETEESEFEDKLSSLESIEIHEKYGVFSESDYDSLSDENQREFYNLMESLDESFEFLHLQYGFSEPVLSEIQHQEFERMIDELNSKYDSVFAEFGFKEPELTETRIKIDRIRCMI